MVSQRLGGVAERTRGIAGPRSKPLALRHGNMRLPTESRALAFAKKPGSDNCTLAGVRRRSDAGPNRPAGASCAAQARVANIILREDRSRAVGRTGGHLPRD